MYETNTFDFILKRMLDRVPGDIDKREGSVIYDALVPAAAELAQLYIELDINLKLAFASTSSGEYLARRVKEMGIERKPATKSRRKGLFYGSANSPLDVPIGSRFSIENVNYVAISKIAPGQFIMEAEIAGTVGNSPVGTMLPIEYIAGLVRAELAEIVLEGMDAETDASLLNRYQLRVRQPATSGNAYQYRQWALEVSGVGDAKIFPLWDGPGTVKVVIVDTDRQPAGSALVSETAVHIEEVRPIGAIVTVVSGVGKEINVSATIILASGYTLQGVVDGFNVALTEYLKSIAFEISYVSYARIGTLLINIPGVLDYTSLLINGGTGNIALASEEIPISGTVSLGV